MSKILTGLMTNRYYIYIIRRNCQTKVKAPSSGKLNARLQLLGHQADAIFQDQRRLIQKLDERFGRVRPESILISPIEICFYF